MMEIPCPAPPEILGRVVKDVLSGGEGDTEEDKRAIAASFLRTLQHSKLQAVAAFPQIYENAHAELERTGATADKECLKAWTFFELLNPDVVGSGWEKTNLKCN